MRHNYKIGQHTNGPCKCLERLATPQKIAAKRKIDFLEKENKEMLEVIRSLVKSHTAGDETDYDDQVKSLKAGFQILEIHDG